MDLSWGRRGWSWSRCEVVVKSLWVVVNSLWVVVGSLWVVPGFSDQSILNDPTNSAVFLYLLVT